MRVDQMAKNQKLALFHEEGPACLPEDVPSWNAPNFHLFTVLKVLAETPECITRLFNTKAINEFGIFSVSCCVGGLYQEVMLDDYFPCKSNGDSIVKIKNGVIWPLVIKKALAKVYGSYGNLTQGLTASAIYGGLTGIAAGQISLETANPEKVKRILRMQGENLMNILAKTLPRKKIQDGETAEILNGETYYRILGCFEVTDET